MGEQRRHMNAFAAVSRADLLHYYALQGETGLQQAAGIMGFLRTEDDTDGDIDTDKDNSASTSVSSDAVEETETGEPAPSHNATFWRSISYEEREGSESQTEVPEWLAATEPYSEDKPDSPVPQPLKPPLVPWSRLWPFLFTVLSSRRDSRAPDIPALLRMVAQGRPILRLPFRKRSYWAAKCTVILDLDRRLVPFWDDAVALVEGLKKIHGRQGLDIVIMENGPDRRCRKWGRELGPLVDFSMPGEGTQVFVVGDLGCLAEGEAVKRKWVSFGRRLKSAGFMPTALMPCPRRKWLPMLSGESLSRYWQMVSWDRGKPLPRIPGLREILPSIPKDQAVPLKALGGPGTLSRKGHQPHVVGAWPPEALLTLLSPAIRVEPELMRAVRLLLPHSAFDVGVEAEVWRHKDVHANVLGFSFAPDGIAYYRSRFKAMGEKWQPLQEAVIGLIEHFHAHLPEGVRGEENLAACELMGKNPEGGIGSHCVRKVVKTQKDPSYADKLTIGKWIRRVGGRVHPEMWKTEHALSAAWLLEHREEYEAGRLVLPPGYDIQDAVWVLGGGGEPVDWVLRRSGNSFVLDDGPWDSGEPGSPVTALTLGNSAVTVGIGGVSVGLNMESVGHKKAQKAQEKKTSIRVPREGTISLETSHERVGLEAVSKPDWAKTITRDSLGLSVTYAAKSSVDADSAGKKDPRLYWLPPGKYTLVLLSGKKTADSSRLFQRIGKGLWLDEAQYVQWKSDGIPCPGWAEKFGVDDYGIFAEFSIKKVKQRMRLIIPGQFKMGSPIKEKERYDDETLHDVMLTKPYWLADTTCTQDLWQAVMGKNPSYFKGGLLPVEEISWQDCVEFIGKVNKKVPGLQLRLPTEAEWEYACRANEEKPFWFGDSITPEQVNYDGSEPYAGGEKGLYRQKTVKVKELPCNGWGLFQMHGNVWEWCADWKNDYPETLVINPMGPSVGEERVLRGGSWFNFGRFVRSAFRNCSKPATRFNNIGVRLAGG